MMRLRLPCAIALAVISNGTAFAQGEGSGHTFSPSVVVTLGKPNVWTMEQAHYLLEKNRAHDLGIAAADLGALDANEIVGYRLEAIKSLLTAQAQYDAVTGKKNSSALSQYNIDMARYNLLRNQSDVLRSRQASLASELAGAQSQLAMLQAQTPPDAKKIAEQNAEITRIQQEQAAVNSEATSLNQALGSEPTLSGLTSTVPTTDETSQSAIGSNSTFASMMANVPQGLNNSKVQASIKLDNYVNLQYEIVAKQLTLLRDEAGPNNRVIFVELPQSIYVTQKFRFYPDVAAFWGTHLVQTWWRLTEVVTAESETSASSAVEGCPAATDQQPMRPPDLRELRLIAAAKLGTTAQLHNQSSEEAALARFFGPEKNPAVASEEKLIASMGGARKVNFCSWFYSWHFSVIDLPHDTPSAPDEQAYSLDLIPRQSALNVADARSSSRAYGFAGLIGLISGFGAKARYEQQRDKYDQFVQQEAYASAFGKGQDTFGWTFGPLPGTKRMAPGLRTTYAVLVVPSSARVLRLEGIGCGYRRRRVPRDPFQFHDCRGSDEDCSQKVSYDLEIPSGEDSFYLDKAYYKPTQAGQRMSLELEGTFGEQTGILINGTPLQKVVSLGQPLLEQTTFNVPPNAGETGIQGVYELVERKKILLSFIVPSTFSGTPRISIISPTHAAVINSYRIEVDDGTGTGKSDRRKLDDALPMFYQPLTISRLTPIYDRSTRITQGPGTSPTLVLELFGQGFRRHPAHRLLINGHALAESPPTLSADLNMNEYRVLDDGLIQARIDRKMFFPHYTADYFILDTNQTSESSISLDDDGPPDFDSCAITVTTDGKTKTAQIKLKGEYFSPTYPPVSSNANFTMTSSSLAAPAEWTVVGTEGGALNQAVLTLKGPSALNSPEIALSRCTVAQATNPKPKKATGANSKTELPKPSH